MLNHLKLKHPKYWKDGKGGSIEQITTFYKPMPSLADYDLALLDMILDGLPLRIVETSGFKRFATLGGYTLPSRQTLTRRIDDEYVREVVKVCDNFKGS